MSDPLDDNDKVHDPARLRAVAMLPLRSARARALLDDFSARAATLLKSPIGLVSIVLDGAQWFAGAFGLEGWLSRTRGTPVEWSFCAEVVRSREPLHVPDARHAALFRDNPLVLHDGVIAYTGVPLLTDEGHVIGSLCAISSEPRAVDAATMERLRALAAELMNALGALPEAER